MANLEKLVKAFEALKVFQPGSLTDEASKKKEAGVSKKEKVVNCNIIADCICSTNLRNVVDFPKFLGIAMETFLMLCDDPESDIRMVADECLNRTIKTLLETNLGRLQVELYKEIKKNGSSRSLRAALWRFADMCHLIRPQKCRPYVVNLLPCISRICQRPEEAIQETLATAMTRMCPVLMGFTNDAEVKLLLKSFLPNLKSSSATCRRAAASSLSLVCQYSRKPVVFFSWLLAVLLDLVIPVSSDRHTHTLLGALLSLRHMIPHLAITETADQSLKGSFGVMTSEKEVKVSSGYVLQVYEVLLYYSGHADHNVVTASLETLQVLLRSSPPNLRQMLVTRGAIKTTSVFEKDITASMGSRSSSQGRLPSVSDDLALEDELDQGSEVSSQTTSGSTDDLDQADLETSDAFDANSSSYKDPSSAQDDVTEEDVSECTDTADLASTGGGDPETGGVEYSGVEIGRLREGASERTDQTMSQSSSADTLSDLKGSETSSPSHRSKLTQPEALKKGVSDEHLSGGAVDGVENLEIDVSEAIQPASSNGSLGSTAQVLRDGDIGSMTDDEIPLVHCVRQLASRFLLTGYEKGLIADRQVRVSVKALALGCIGSALMLHPAAFLTKLHISSPQPGKLQEVQDLLQYMSHSDPQLKGNTALLVGNLLHAALVSSGGDFTKWANQHSGTGGVLTVEQLVGYLSGLLEDDSSVATRLALIALKTCLPTLLYSAHSHLGLRIILSLLHLRDNPYWLVKVELLELLGEVDFKLVSFLESICPEVKKGHHHFIGRLNLQDHILSRVIYGLLGDEDGRVRHVAATTLVRIVPRLFYGVDNPQHDPVTAKARELTANYLDPIIHDWCHTPQPLVHGLSQPYHLYDPNKYSPILESSLSRVVASLTATLQCTTSRHMTYGCLRALSLLSEEYMVTQYSQAWGCAPPTIPQTGPRTPTRGSKQRTSSTSRWADGGSPMTSMVGVFSNLSIDDLCVGCGGGPLAMILSQLTSSSAMMDLSAHQDALQLAGHVFAGAAFRCLRSAEEVSGLDPNSDEAKWASLSDRKLVPLADQLVSHIARLLNICAHVIEDQTPGPPQLKPSLPSLPNAPSLSPIKRKAKAMKEDHAEKGKDAASTEGKPSGKTDKKGEKEKEGKEEKNKKEGLGTFYSLPFYMKLYEVLKGAYSNYKLSLDLSSTDKFGSLLQAGLETFSLMLEVAGLPEVGKHAEELLSYLRAAVTLEATTAIHCVQQLLKALFGTNLASQWENNEVAPTSRKPGKAARLTSNVRPGLYHSIFTTPYMQFSQCMSGATFKTTTAHAEEESSSLISWLKKRAERKIPAVLKPGSKADKTSIASYIRLFEPLVIKALKQYTVTSSLQLQHQVLNLLAQLVQLRVNYCLLDSDQIFIGFVIKQFEFIEEGQIRNSETLIPHIFYFLVLLSYERYHSKTIIGMPKIIQLCDGIMASGQQPTTHAIPALQPIVHDLFVSRSANKADAGKDLDTQREVVVSMLLRLIQYHQVLEMFIIVLHQCHKESEDKWKRLSRQVTDMVLPLLAKQQVNLDHRAGLDVVHRLFECVAPSVFRPVDVLLKTLLAPPHDISTVTGLQRWLCLVLAILRVLISQSKEEVVLSRLTELDLRLTLFTHTLGNHKTHALEEEVKAANLQALMTPENMLARFLLQVVGVVGQEVRFRCTDLTSSSAEYAFLCQELAHLLLYITHMFQSDDNSRRSWMRGNCGLYRRVAMAAMACMRKDRSESTPPGLFSLQMLNDQFRAMGSTHPTLTLQWCNLLILMNVDDQQWWSDILQTPRKYMLSSPTRPTADPEEARPTSGGRCHSEIVRRGGLVLFCDYVCENLSDAEHMTWVIINHVSDVINLSHEPPVKDFISAIHRNSAASGLLIQAIHSRCENMTRAAQVKKTLHCLEAIHLSQSGALLTLLVDKFLSTTHLAVARFCDMIACRRVEMLLAESVDDSSSQLPLEDLEKLLQFMKTHGLTTRHARLASLLNKLRVLMCPESRMALSPERTHPLAVTPTAVSDIRMNKELFALIVRDQCFSMNPSPRECAKLLRHLDYGSILNIIMAKEFNLSILEECIALGTHLTLSKIHLTRQQDESIPADPLTGSPAKEFLDPLLGAAQMTLFRHINSIINMLPVPHRIINYDESTNLQEEQYKEKLEDCVGDAPWCESVFQLAAALLQYLVSLPMLPWKPDVPQESSKDICRFSLLCLEVLEWQVHQDVVPTSAHLQVALESLALVLQDRRLSDVIGQTDQATWVCSAIRTVHTLLASMLVLPGERLVTLPNQESQDDLPTSSFDDFHHVIRACDQISELVHCLKTHLSSHQVAPRVSQYLAPTLRNVIIGLARLPLVNSYARTPPLVWKLGWLPSPGGDMKTKLPPLPLDFLQEKDILREFIFRVNILGWTSRQQFEETWMSLLGVLNPAPLGDEQHVSIEEDIDRAQTMVLAVRCITSLLVQSTLTPYSGNPSNSICEHRPRDKPLAFLHTRCGRKLAYIRGLIEREIQALARQRCDLDTHHATTQWRVIRHKVDPGHRSDLDPHQPYAAPGGGGQMGHPEQLFYNNIERELGDQSFCLGQMSIESIWGLVGMLDPNQILQDSSSDTTTGTDSTVDSPRQIYPPVHQVSLPVEVRERSALVSGLDIHSCLQLLLELYGQVLTGNPGSTRVPLMQLNETIRSILALSDIFTERSQFEWMLDVLLEVQRIHPVEDELAGQYLVVAICKAAAIVGMDVAVADRLVKTIENSLRSTHLPTKEITQELCKLMTRMSEGIDRYKVLVVGKNGKLNETIEVAALYGAMYILEAGMSEVVHQLIPHVTEYLLKQLTNITHTTITSQQHVLLMWACTFYIVENYQEEIKEMDFTAKMLQVAITTASGPEEMTPLSTYLAILRGLERLLLASVLTRQDSEALVKLSVDRLCLPSPQRSLASLGLMLTCMYTGKSGDAWSPSGLQDPPRFPNPAMHIMHDPESLIVAMERVTVLFDRIRKGLPYEARVITQALPTFLADFFPPQDIMNKVIGEFLSSQQPHPQLMATVVFQVFENLLQKDQKALVRDWVMLSLSNFTQRTPVAMAIWSLTCFFISASTNPWLRALLPHAVSRMGRMDSVDRRLFCIAALDLCSQLTDEAQLRTFHSTFQGVAQPDTAYADLVACCT